MDSQCNQLHMHGTVAGIGAVACPAEEADRTAACT